MKKWTRWQDWVAVAAGLYAVLSPIWTRSDARTTGTAIVLGALIIIAGLVNLATPRQNAVEWIEAVLAALLFISPWALSYTDMYGMAWTAWIVGAVTVIVGIWGARFAEIRTHGPIHG